MFAVIQLFKTHVDYVERTKPLTAEHIHWYVYFKHDAASFYCALLLY